MSRGAANILLLCAGAVWGMGFIAQSTAMDHIGPLSFVAIRFLIATLVVVPLAVREARCSSRRRIERGVLGWFVVIGAAMFAGMAAQQIGLLTTTVSNSGFLTGLYVVLTPLMAVVLFRELPPPIVWPGAALAMLGIFLLSGGDLAQLVAGDLLTLLGAVFWALQVVLIARFVTRSARPYLLAAVQFLTVALMAFLAAWLLDESLTLDALWHAAPQLLYAGVFAGALAFTLQIVAQSYTSAAQAAIFLSSEAPFAAAFGALFLGERLGLPGLAGCVAILCSMLLVELVPAGRARPSDAHRAG